MSCLKTELQACINHYLFMDKSNPADFILAEYIQHCLEDFDHMSKKDILIVPPDSEEVKYEN